MISNPVIYNLLSSLDGANSAEYISAQAAELLKKGHCSIIKGKDYELEAGASAINGLINEYETADVYLYAAIERKDWQQVSTIYEQVFRPYLYQHAINAVTSALEKKV